MLPVTYTLKELEEVLKLKPQALQRLISSGKLPGRKIGKKFVVTEQNILLFLEKQQERPSNS